MATEFNKKRRGRPGKRVTVHFYKCEGLNYIEVNEPQTFSSYSDAARKLDIPFNWFYLHNSGDYCYSLEMYLKYYLDGK